jgi:hypothetical protein
MHVGLLNTGILSPFGGNRRPIGQDLRATRLKVQIRVYLSDRFWPISAGGERQLWIDSGHLHRRLRHVVDRRACLKKKRT